MITNSGKTFIKRYLAGQAGAMVGAMTVGIGTTAASTSDTRMVFEFERIKCDIIAYDFVNDRLVFKGTLPADLSGKIYEVGVWSTEASVVAAGQASRIITTFDSASEAWTPGSYESTVARIGADSLQQVPTASTTVTSTLNDLTLDFIQNGANDVFVLAYNIDTANTANIKLRFMVDASNYYEYTVTTPTAGYKFSSFNKGAATVVGVPTWDNINMLQVATTATAGGVASVEFDGLRIEDVDTIDPDYGLIARFVPGSPIVKEAGAAADFEFALTVSL